MQLARDADQARLDGNSRQFRELTEEAFRLEREAADELMAHPESEPTRGVLFRSAASLALNIGKFAEARELIATALSGNPFPEIKVELQELQQKVASEIGHQSDYTSLDVYSTTTIASELEFNYASQVMRDFKSIFEKLSISSSETDKDRVQEIFYETSMVIFASVGDQKILQNILSKTVQSFQTQFYDFEVESFSQARSLLYLTAHYQSIKYLREIGEKQINPLGKLMTFGQASTTFNIVQKFFSAYYSLPKQTIRILDLLLEGSTPSQLDLPPNIIHEVKNKAINLVPDVK